MPPEVMTAKEIDALEQLLLGRAPAGISGPSSHTAMWQQSSQRKPKWPQLGAWWKRLRKGRTPPVAPIRSSPLQVQPTPAPTRQIILPTRSLPTPNLQGFPLELQSPPPTYPGTTFVPQVEQGVGQIPGWLAGRGGSPAPAYPGTTLIPSTQTLQQAQSAVGAIPGQLGTPKQGFWQGAKSKLGRGAKGAARFGIPMAINIGAGYAEEALTPAENPDPGLWQRVGSGAAEGAAAGSWGFFAGGVPGVVGTGIGALTGAAKGAGDYAMVPTVGEERRPDLDSKQIMDLFVAYEESNPDDEEDVNLRRAVNAAENINQMTERAPLLYQNAAFGGQGAAPEYATGYAPPEQMLAAQTQALQLAEPYLQQQEAVAAEYANIVRNTLGDPVEADRILKDAQYQSSQVRTFAMQWPYLQAQMRQQEQLDAIAEQVWNQAVRKALEGETGGGNETDALLAEAGV